MATNALRCCAAQPVRANRRAVALQQFRLRLGPAHGAAVVTRRWVVGIPREFATQESSPRRHATCLRPGRDLAAASAGTLASRCLRPKAVASSSRTLPVSAAGRVVSGAQDGGSQQPQFLKCSDADGAITCSELKAFGSATAYAPAMLVIPKLVPLGGQEAEAAWLREGCQLLEGMVGQGMFSWVHFPAAVAGTGAKKGPGHECSGWSNETTVIVFRNREQLELWRDSAERLNWLESAPHHRLSVDTVDLPKDYLEQWTAGAQLQIPGGPSVKPPAAWKVILNVLLPLYPMVALNALLLVPVLDALVAPFAALPPILKILATLSWTLPYVVLVGVPTCRRILEAAGLFAEGRFKVARGVVVAATLVTLPPCAVLVAHSALQG